MRKICRKKVTKKYVNFLLISKELAYSTCIIRVSHVKGGVGCGKTVERRSAPH